MNSTNNNLLSNETDPFSGIQSPINCDTLKYFTVYSILMFGSSLIFNSLLLIAFCKNKELRIPINMLILAITVMNLLATCSEMSFIIPSTFNCR